MDWWPFNRKKITHEVIDMRVKPILDDNLEEIKVPATPPVEDTKVCKKHSWIVDKTSQHYYITKDGDATYYHQILLPRDSEIEGYPTFYRGFAHFTDFTVRTYKEAFFDGVCKDCGAVKLDYTLAVNQAKDDIKRIKEEMKAAKSELNKHRKTLEEARKKL